MNVKKFLRDFILTFVIAFSAGVIVTFVWNLIIQGTSRADWETPFRLAIILGVVLPLSRSIRSGTEVKG